MHKEEIPCIIVAIIVIPALFFLVSLLGFEAGINTASRQITNGERECITLPDERVVCWEVDK